MVRGGCIESPTPRVLNTVAIGLPTRSSMPSSPSSQHIARPNVTPADSLFSDATIEAVHDWLHAAGIHRDRHRLSTGLNWLGFKVRGTLKSLLVIIILRLRTRLLRKRPDDFWIPHTGSSSMPSQALSMSLAIIIVFLHISANISTSSPQASFSMQEQTMSPISTTMSKEGSGTVDQPSRHGHRRDLSQVARDRAACRTVDHIKRVLQ